MFLILAVKYSFAQAPDPDFTDKMAWNEGQSRIKSATFIESADYASYDLVYQQLKFDVEVVTNPKNIELDTNDFLTLAGNMLYDALENEYTIKKESDD